MVKPILFTLFTFACLSLCAQKTASISGSINDDKGNGIELVNIVVIDNQNINAISDEKGSYSIVVPANRKFTLSFSSIGFNTIQKQFKLKEGDSVIVNVKMPKSTVSFPEVIIEDRFERNKVSTVKIDVSQGTLPDAGGGNIEAYLVAQALGVSKSNELSSSYSVRGGNFDENLVYVNDFEVFRPFLIRSGQQEGLSFANPNLVSNISFSSGGFEPKYGDKLASVLDIQYKKPKEFGGSIGLSFLGANAHLEGSDAKKRFTYLVGFRQKSNKYLLTSLDTRGEYTPSFIDFQTYLTYKLSDKLDVELIGNYAQNKYEYIPVDRETTFGVVNEILRLNVFFDGKELDRYNSAMGGLAFKHQINDNLSIKWLGSAYRTNEIESFDIIGEYFIGEVETDFNDDNFGGIRRGLGVGTIQDWARNSLESTIYYAGQKGSLKKGQHFFKWGLDYKHEIIEDKLSEWERLDSAGYSLSFSTEQVNLFSVLKSNFNLSSNRYAIYLQDSWQRSDSSVFGLTYGVRSQYWDVNEELLISPRIQAYLYPKWKNDIVFTGALGLYQQAPFYREMRKLDGVVNLDLKAQKSIHAVGGLDYNFTAWDRPFKFTTEVYYKYLWDVVPYELDNVLIRYFGENLSKAYVAGIDFRLNGELVPGDESWISFSLLQTKEDIEGDYIETTITDENGETTFASQEVGYIPRPTDQRVNFALFFQDHIPQREYFKVHLNLLFATGLPFGPPDGERYEDQLRIPPYRRVDIGFSAELFNIDRRIENKGNPENFFRHLDNVWLSLEVLNMFGINNTVSYLWVRDFQQAIYAVPNNLTARRFNLRLKVDF